MKQAMQSQAAEYESVSLTFNSDGTGSNSGDENFTYTISDKNLTMKYGYGGAPLSILYSISGNQLTTSETNNYTIEELVDEELITEEMADTLIKAGVSNVKITTISVLSKR